ncbi:hypothetical protein HYFRA_00012413 [Hymenoscyphus fraxineus]|uniref:Heterokaryon incompatibility domain-containing protein n=1 Tax=Hymenoscyphus fraxineus TaxID=746836 RepID=A0A9N9L756_9HELO|nr:hypothetical protein HYFRA_00012413 [Hymenoscyphus fraxineus]
MLCENCSDLDLIAALGEGYRGIQSIVHYGKDWVSRISDPGVVWAWDGGKDCEFCDFVARISEDREPDNLKPGFLLVAQHDLLDSGLHPDCYPIFEVVFVRPTAAPEGLQMRCRSAEDRVAFDTRDKINKLHPQADFDAFRRSLKTCIEQHRHCRLDTDTPPLRLRLIDCETSGIVSAPKDVPYAALSYIWGKSNNGSTKDSELPTDIPLTIKDAIEVTMKLGLRYLWVDKYCILQDDEDDRKHQIQQMDLVYRFAEVTLIAAAGDHDNAGLLGVSCSDRRVQITGTFRGTTLVTCSTYPFQAVLDSYWHSRGWTFQESFFSRRRLFFGENQIVYDCAEATEVESFVSNQKLKVIPQWRSDILPIDIFDLVDAYSKRNLTFPADALNAFEGILNAFNAREPSVKAHWGIPVLPNGYDNRPNFQGSRIASLLCGLCWSHHHNALVHRREGFPSWSWTGWEGIYISYGAFVNSKDSNITVPSETEIYVGNGNEPKIEWSDFLSRLSTQDVHHGVSQQLWLSAPSFNVRLRNSDSGLKVYSDQDEQLSITPQRVYLDSQFQGLEHLDDATSAHIDTRSCFAILLFLLWEGEEGWGQQYFLLVSKKQDVWERIGIWYSELYFKDEFAKFEKKFKASQSYQTREFCIQ